MIESLSPRVPHDHNGDILEPSAQDSEQEQKVVEEAPFSWLPVITDEDGPFYYEVKSA